MQKHSLNRALYLADMFEYHALIKNNCRSWAIKSLISLADNNFEIELFSEELARFLGVSLSEEDTTEWLNKNASLMSNEFSKSWTVNADEKYTYLQCYDGTINNQDTFSRIYKMPISSENASLLKIKQSALLIGSNKIPTLYYYKLIPLSAAEGLIDSKLYPYMYIAQTLKSLFMTPIDNDFSIRFEKFVNHNKHKLNHIANFISNTPKFINRGSDGAVFDIGPTYVLKIFQDKVAFNHAKEAMQRWIDDPKMARTEAMIYSADSLGEFDGHSLYYYIMEKMTLAESLPQEDKDHLTNIVQKIIMSINLAREDWKEIKNIIKDPSQLDLVKQKIQEGVANISGTIKETTSKEINSLHNDLKLREGWLESLIEEVIMKYLTSRTDLKIDNLGLTAYKEFRYFDPSFDFTTSNIAFTRFNDKSETMPAPPMV
jgi:hypothetical protein